MDLFIYFVLHTFSARKEEKKGLHVHKQQYCSYKEEKMGLKKANGYARQIMHIIYVHVRPSICMYNMYVDMGA